MWKKVIVVLIALGFAWSVPQVRGRIAKAASPAVELLGPVGDRMQRPMRRYQAETDLKFLADQLVMDRNEGRQVPVNAKTFNEWLVRKQTAGEKGRDPWGNLYWLDRGRGAMTLGSNGPDGTRATADDLTRPADL